MSCDGKCETCPVQCGASKLLKNVKENMEEKKMSENILSCKSTDGEKVAVHGAWIDGTKKTVMIIGFGVAVVFGGLWYLNGKISDVKFNTALEIEKVKTSSEIRIKNLEKQLEEIKKDYAQMKEYAEDGRRAYEAAKKFRQRNR